MPAGCLVRVCALDGQVEVGDVGGSFEAQVRGSGSVRAGDVGVCDLTVRGSGSVFVLSAAGDVHASVQRSGSACLHSGDVERVRADVQGSGEFEFAGVCAAAAPNVQGSGEAHIRTCATEPAVSVIGSGEVTVGGRTYCRW